MTKSIRIDEETHKRLKIHAAETGSSVVEIVKAAVDEFIQDVPVVRESLKKSITPKKFKIELPEPTLVHKGFVKPRGELRGDDYV